MIGMREPAKYSDISGASTTINGLSRQSPGLRLSHPTASARYCCAQSVLRSCFATKPDACSDLMARTLRGSDLTSPWDARGLENLGALGGLDRPRRGGNALARSGASGPLPQPSARGIVELTPAERGRRAER